MVVSLGGGVAKSDLSKGLIEMKASEETIQNTYDQESKENEIETTTKNKNGKYKTNKPKGLDTSNAEFTSDKVVTERGTQRGFARPRQLAHGLHVISSH